MSCCPTEILPVASDYVGTGAHVYVAGKPVKGGILYIPDIFGALPNAQHVCDLLANHGYLVVMPDFFPSNSAWPTSDFPPKDGFGGAPFQAFIGSLQYDRVKPVVEQGVAILRGLGATKIGAVGNCWGGKIALRANCDGLVSAAASPHPSFLTESDGAEAKGPICLLPSKDEDDALMQKVMAAASAHAAKNVHKRYDNMHHGFLAARSDWNNEENRAAANDALAVLVRFFDAAL